ncbi:MAG: pilus assembly protein PilM, partial [Patescibacteria group bacterium]
MSLFFSNKSYLGIDIGSSSVKIVELKGQAGGVRLVTYGFSENLFDLDRKDVKEIAKIINEICYRSGVISHNAVSALPAFSVFSSIINLNGVNKKDIDSAIQWEAKKVIPLPPEEMKIDWRKIET